MSDNELPGMWEEADFTGGQDEERPATDAEVRDWLGPSNANTHRDRYPRSAAGLRGKATSPEAAALESAAGHGDLPANSLLGEVKTRELLEELRLRGDLLMTAMPTTERGQDGAVMSSIATAALKSSTKQTLEAIRGE